MKDKEADRMIEETRVKIEKLEDIRRLRLCMLLLVEEEINQNLNLLRPLLRLPPVE